jgi:hypothetical protein
MFTIITLIALFIVLDMAAMRWGCDSTDTFASCEYDRRWHWYNHVDDQSAVC